MGRRSTGWRTVLKGPFWAGVIMLVPSISQAVAADVEYRTFRVTIDGKQAGDYQMNIGRHHDGTMTVTGRANVRFKATFFYTYTYFYQGTEIWKDGRLQRLNSTSNDDGKRFTVSAQADGNALRITVNDQERTMRGDVWTTSAWRLPAAKDRNGGLALLDVDTGRELAGTMQYVGTNQVNVAGRLQDCVHYRVTGDVQLELWYDAHERLVRQESIEDGHRTVLELTDMAK